MYKNDGYTRLLEEITEDFEVDGLSFFLDEFGILYYMYWYNDDKNTISDWKRVTKSWMYNLFYGNRMRNGEVIHC